MTTNIPARKEPRLSIDTSTSDDIIIALTDKGTILHKEKIEAHHAQAELLLPSIDRLLKANGYMANDLVSIEVNETGESFTATRIGISTANALGFALGIPVTVSGSVAESGFKQTDIVRPKYNKYPNISKEKPKL